MIRWCSTVLGALGFALSYGIPACAQGAAKPEASSGSALFTLLVLFTPLIIIIVFFMIPMMRKAKRNTAQIDRSLELGEENLLLAKEQVALQTETNRLLRQVIEALGRD